MTEERRDRPGMCQMRLGGLAVDPASNTPVIILRDLDDLHLVPIWIGQPEAVAIASELEGYRHARPMTHDLLKATILTLGHRLDRVEVCDLKDNTFFAAAILLDEKGREVRLDSRPSDAIALAIRMDATIYVHDHVVRQARVDPVSIESEDDEAPEDGDENGATGEARALVFQGPAPSSDEEWEEYLKDLDPSDFGKYKQ